MEAPSALLLRWQAPQPCPAHPEAGSPGPTLAPRRGTPNPTLDPTPNPTLDSTHATRVPALAFGVGVTAGKSPCGGPVARKKRGRLAPLGGEVRPRRKERFARLIHRRVRDFGGPSVRAAYGGNMSLPSLPLRVVGRRYQASDIGEVV